MFCSNHLVDVENYIISKIPYKRGDKIPTMVELDYTVACLEEEARSIAITGYNITEVIPRLHISFLHTQECKINIYWEVCCV